MFVILRKRISHGTKAVLYDGDVQLQKLDIQSVPISYEKVNNMFDRGARDNFMAPFNIMSFH